MKWLLTTSVLLTVFWFERGLAETVLQRRYQGFGSSVVNRFQTRFSPPEIPPPPFPLHPPGSQWSQTGQQSRRTIQEGLLGARKVISAGNKFGLGLMQHLINENDNTIMAPVSLSVALGMVYFASAGNTKKELARALHYDEFGLNEQTVVPPLRYLTQIAKAEKPKGVSYENANFVFADKDLNVSEDYRNIVQDVFTAKVQSLDFKRPKEAVAEMNSLISNATHNLIPNPIENVNPSARVVLTNAVYFKGFWKKPFSVRSSFDSTFLNDGISEVPVKMMYMRDNFLVKPLPEIEADAIQLPYDGDASIMLILLPRNPQGVNGMLQKLNIANLIDDLPTYRNESLDLHIPRFTVSGSYRFKPQLYNLGIRDLFTPGKADLPQLDPEGETIVDDVIHEAKIRVDERGTEAVAITTATIINYSRYPSFNVRHPFVFFVIHKQLGSIFFAGKIIRMNHQSQPTKL